MAFDGSRLIQGRASSVQQFYRQGDQIALTAWACKMDKAAKWLKSLRKEFGKTSHQDIAGSFRVS